MNNAITLICLFSSSLILITFGILNTFLTKQFNNFVEKKSKKVIKKKIKFKFLNGLGIKKELKILKTFGILMFGFGIFFMGVFVTYTEFLKNSSS